MKLISFLLLLFFTIPQAPKQQRQVLFDFRLDHVTKSPKISPATQRDVLSKVFRRYLTDANRCKHGVVEGDDYLAQSRKAGQIVPQIAEMATGSFTAAGQNETAYVIFVNECTASHADNFGTKRVAIFQGPKLVADVDVDFRGSIMLKTDLDNDGINELLMTTGDMAQGTLVEMGSLLSFQNGRVRVIQDFGTVVEDSCASAMPGSTSKAVMLSIPNGAPFQMPKIKVDYYATGCSRVKRWRPFKGPI
ncbi:MAG TPA: hypothetical protein VGJ37_06195 [Pyrinomonadaceae bacterium]|jgi:hypothetical protein